MIACTSADVGGSTVHVCVILCEFSFFIAAAVKLSSSSEGLQNRIHSLGNGIKNVVHVRGCNMRRQLQFQGMV